MPACHSTAATTSTRSPARVVGTVQLQAPCGGQLQVNPPPGGQGANESVPLAATSHRQRQHGLRRPVDGGLRRRARFGLRDAARGRGLVVVAGQRVEAARADRPRPDRRRDRLGDALVVLLAPQQEPSLQDASQSLYGSRGRHQLAGAAEQEELPQQVRPAARALRLDRARRELVGEHRQRDARRAGPAAQAAAAAQARPRGQAAAGGAGARLPDAVRPVAVLERDQPPRGDGHVPLGDRARRERRVRGHRVHV